MLDGIRFPHLIFHPECAQHFVLRPVGTTLRIDAGIGEPQPLHRPSRNQMLSYDFRRVFRLHMAVPDSLGVHHNGGSVLALIQAPGFVDAHLAAQAGGPGKLLQLRVQFALAVRGAAGAWRIGRAGVVADKDVAFKRGQSVTSSARIYPD